MRVLAHGIAWLLLLPLFLLARIATPYSGFTAASQLLALVPGLMGVMLRRVWYAHTLKKCGCNLTVDWLAVIRSPDSEIGDRCTIGVSCWLGWVKMGDDVLFGNQVTCLSGGRQHAFDDLSRPMRQQPGSKRQLVIGTDVWVGSGAIIMADIQDHTVVGAGSVVTKSHPHMSVIAGNPARVLRSRGGGEAWDRESVCARKDPQ